MITKEEFTMVHTLKLRGYSMRAISRMTGLNRRTISKRLKEDDLKSYKKKGVIKAKMITSKRLEEEKSYLIPLESIVSVEAKKSNKEKAITNASLTNIDISYFTTLNDYEQLLLNGY